MRVVLATDGLGATGTSSDSNDRDGGAAHTDDNVETRDDDA